MKGGLDEVLRLKRVHSIWVRSQFILGAMPVFCLINRFQPILSDGYGGDLIPSLLPESLSGHYNLLIVIGLLALAMSEILRRRFHARHKEDLNL
jgi:hypothetical protein